MDANAEGYSYFPWKPRREPCPIPCLPRQSEAVTGRLHFIEYQPLLRQTLLARTSHKPSTTTADLTTYQSLPLPADLRGFQSRQAGIARRPAERL